MCSTSQAGDTYLFKRERRGRWQDAALLVDVTVTKRHYLKKICISAYYRVLCCVICEAALLHCLLVFCGQSQGPSSSPFPVYCSSTRDPQSTSSGIERSSSASATMLRWPKLRITTAVQTSLGPGCLLPTRSSIAAMSPPSLFTSTRTPHPSHDFPQPSVSWVFS